jgi:hypothetical protein
MSTIRHHHTDQSLIWYVAAAAAAAIVGFYLFVLLGPASHSTSPAPTVDIPQVVEHAGYYEPLTKACYALRPNDTTIDLARPQCATAHR